MTHTQVLLQMADDFIESAVSASCQLAKHRKSGTLETKDLQVYLESSWNMTIPGFSSDDQSSTSTSKKTTASEAHKQVCACVCVCMLCQSLTVLCGGHCWPKVMY